MDLTFFEKFNIPREVVTLDIETEATTPDAVICTIGAVIINIVTGEERAEFYTRCITQTQVDQLGRVTDEETQAFWLKQSEENPTAFDEAFDHSLLRFELKAALEAFKDWYYQNFTAGQRPAVFANGPEFDCVIVAHAYKQLLLELPWDHGCNQSVRTMVWMGRVILGIDPKKELHFEGDRHDALADARHEAQQIHHIFKAFLQLKERLHWLTGPAVIPAPADISESELVALANEPGQVQLIPERPLQQVIINLTTENGQLTVSTEFEPGLAGENSEEYKGMSEDQKLLQLYGAKLWAGAASSLQEPD
jgi:hypothetical protein